MHGSKEVLCPDPLVGAPSAAEDGLAVIDVAEGRGSPPHPLSTVTTSATAATPADRLPAPRLMW
ncbi:hypothetical protein ACLMAL_03180 [Nocardia sp. CWNU-33]|uniref:hypothetical protein n=1 Tax=Nocardia sp. CWNU-33 TaxID=3392117 RepID=UPI00398EC5EC